MPKATYVDGFVLVVPKKNVAAYKKMATEGMKAWKKFGALDYKECTIDDAKPAHVSFTFPKMANAKPSDVVFFSFITFKSRAHRDQVNKKVMKYFEEEYKGPAEEKMPFDMKKFAYAGFKVLVG